MNNFYCTAIKVLEIILSFNELWKLMNILYRPMINEKRWVKAFGEGKMDNELRRTIFTRPTVQDHSSIFYLSSLPFGQNLNKNINVQC